MNVFITFNMNCRVGPVVQWLDIAQRKLNSKWPEFEFWSWQSEKHAEWVCAQDPNGIGSWRRKVCGMIRLCWGSWTLVYSLSFFHMHMHSLALDKWEKYELYGKNWWILWILKFLYFKMKILCRRRFRFFFWESIPLLTVLSFTVHYSKDCPDCFYFTFLEQHQSIWIIFLGNSNNNSTSLCCTRYFLFFIFLLQDNN